MNRYSCEQIVDMLVDYADEELPAAERQAVAAHLADCQGCRSTLAWLQQSLRWAQVLWEDAQAQIDGSLTQRQAPELARLHGYEPANDNDAGSGPCCPGGLSRAGDSMAASHSTMAPSTVGFGRIVRRRLIRLLPAAIAASILLLLLEQLAWRAVGPRQDRSAVAHKDTPVQRVRPALPEHVVQPATNLALVEYDIDRAGQAATILAATDTYLADQPGCQDVAKDQYAFIARAYAGTEAAATARQRLESFLERRTVQ